MGYELKYFYKEELETKGEYSEEIKEKKVKVGDPWEEVPLESVAGKIMAQLARRNILIVDVEIYKLAKEKVSYRTTDDGIVIKNRKFKFDDGPAIEATEVAEVAENGEGGRPPAAGSEPTRSALQTQQAIKKTNNPEAMINLAKRILRYEIFDAQHPLLASKAKTKGKFTLNKRYPIYEEITKGMPPTTTTFYMTIDDAGKEVEINAECFTYVSNPTLSFDGVGDGKDPGIPLSFGNGSSEQMIDIRRR